MLPRFTYVRPSTLESALTELARAESLVHGGGTDLLGCLRDGALDTKRVVSLRDLDELRGIAPTPHGGLRLGAMTTVAEIAANPVVAQRYRVLADAAASVASPQLRHQGTLGGNLCQKPRCWYYRGEYRCLRKGGDMCYAFDGENEYHCILGGDMCYIVHPSDTAPALVALEAVARVAGPGSSRSVAVEALHVPPSVDPQREVALEPGEVLTEVILPTPPTGLRSSYRKVRARASWDFALAGVALALAVEDRMVRSARVVLSGVAPVPWRVRAAETELEGNSLDDATIRRAAEATVVGAEPLEGNGYKVQLVIGLVTAQLEALRG